jgi:hypothetical protein
MTLRERARFHVDDNSNINEIQPSPTDGSLSRRAFGEGALGSLLAYSLIETLIAGDAFGDDVKPIATTWLSSVNDLGKSLKGGALTQQQWQTKVEELLRRVELGDLMASLKMEQLMATVEFRERGEKSLRPKLPVLPEVKGMPTRYVFGHQIFALKQGRSVPPHGHYNMATLFLVLNGKFHGRHYDRVDEDDKTMIVKPTINQQFSPGEYSTVTDFKDNVHWFKATSETGFIFNIHLLRIDPKARKGGRVYIDPAGEKLQDGAIRAPKISASEALKKYG